MSLIPRSADTMARAGNAGERQLAVEDYLEIYR